MQKRSLTIIVIALLCALVTAFALVGCGKVDFKLNFFVDGEVYDTISTNGKEAIKLPDNPKKDGYIFDGWYWDNEIWKKPFTANSLLDTPLSSDMSVYAKFEKEEALKGTQAEFVGFEKVGENKYFKKVSNDTEIFSLGTLVKVNSKSSWIASYDVSCTKIILSKIVELSVGDNLCYVNVTAENGNMSLYTLNIRRREIYEVSFADSDVQSQYIEEDSCAAAPSTANRTGYTFESWNFDFSTPIVENTVISAKWNVVTYNIEYVLNGGDNNSLNPTTYNIKSEEIVLQMPSKTGYDFVGWYADEALTEKAEKIATGSYGNKKFYTKWNISSYNIEYELNGGVNNSANPTTYTIESEKIVLQTPSKTGYDFVGWYTNKDLTEKIEKIVAGTYGNKKFYAKWTPTVYTVEYELYGGENNSANPTTYTIESEEIVLQEPTIQSEDYDGFIGWFSDKELRYEALSIKQGSYGNKTFYAKWSSKYYLFDTHSKTITGLTDYGKTCSEVVIPEKLYDIAVSSIGDYAFSGCTRLTSVTIPDSMTRIGGSAFSGCTGLTRVTIPNSVTSIGGGAFRGCTSMTSVAIGNSVTNIGGSAFSGCTGLTRVTIPDSVTSIDSWAFAGCTGLTSVTIGNSVTSTGNYVFNGCTRLTSVTIPDSVTSIGNGAFSGCTRLTSVTIPDSVTSIGESAFKGCTGLAGITIPDGVTSIGNMAFYGCSLTSIYYAGDVASWCGISGLNNIMSNARTLYIDKKKVEGELVIPNSVTSVGDYAFCGCTGLTRVTIPDSVTSIGSHAFSYCNGIESVTVDVGNIAYHSSNNCIIKTQSKTLVFGCKNSIIPDDGSVTSIGFAAFSGCTELTSVTIPESVTSIENYVFCNCSGLKTIYYKGTEEQWNAIIKDDNWNYGAWNYTIVYNA